MMFKKFQIYYLIHHPSCKKRNHRHTKKKMANECPIKQRRLESIGIL